jgi:hypothetical protein
MSSTKVSWMERNPNGINNLDLMASGFGQSVVHTGEAQACYVEIDRTKSVSLNN